jgi:hypothetical protein
MPGAKKIQFGILGLLIIGFVFTVSSALAYWQEVTVSNTVDVVVIREGAELIVDDLNNKLDDKRLVPQGYRMFTNDVDEVEFTYNAGISRELINSVNLHISATNITIGGEETYAQLVDINILNQGDKAQTDLFNDTVSITIVVRLIEPIDEAEAVQKDLDTSRVNVEDSKEAYESIKGEVIEFTLEFSLSSKTESNNEN